MKINPYNGIPGKKIYILERVLFCAKVIMSNEPDIAGGVIHIISKYIIIILKE